MPLSSSGYFYPGLQVANSSYPSVDLRGLGVAPDTVGGIGRIYMMSGSGDLFYKDPSGNEIFLGSEISSSAGYVTGSTNFFVTSQLVASGTIVSPGYLILSSSAGSYVYISGSLFASGSNHTITGSISISDNLSASVINFPVDAVSTFSHVRASNSHLVLSSSTGTVTVSGALNVVGGRTIVQGFGQNGTPDFRSTAATNAGFLFGNSFVTTIANGSNMFQVNSVGAEFINGTSFTMPVGMKLINSGHMVLSSSLSLIRFSGAAGFLDTVTAELPTDATILSGSIVWDSTRKALKIYGPEGWTVIATGTVG